MRRRDARRAARAARRAEAGRLIVPEGIALHLPVAGLGVRWAAQIADILITVLALVALMVLLGLLDLLSPRTLTAVGALCFFLIRVPYYAITELIWNGQTLGKRLMRIKVVAQDGGPLTTHAIVLRNLMKEAEIFLPATLLVTLDADRAGASLLALAWVLAGLAVPLANPRRQRLGDLMAGTYVIHLPQPVLLADLAVAAARAGAQAAPVEAVGGAAYRFLDHHLDHYGAFELQTLEDLLRVEDRPRGPAARRRREATLAAVVARIRAKIGYADPVPPDRAVAFLSAFYHAQRAHLERKRLFGDRREDKHYRGAGAEGDPAPRADRAAPGPAPAPETGPRDRR
jgi:uncharacterized RDD family membrane protein YckC